MKKLISIFLLISICSQLIVKVGVIASWKFNQKYISENLCVNRNKPEMECNGKCHLQKQLENIDNEESEKDAPFPSILKSLKTDDFVNNSELLTTLAVSGKLNSEFLTLNNLYSFDTVKACFHPPQV